MAAVGEENFEFESVEGEEDDFDDEESRSVEEEKKFRRYDLEKYSAMARKASGGTVPENFLEFDHSFAYDCRKYFNLCVVDPDTVVFASANLLTFLYVPRRHVFFKRASAGGGIGHLTKNPAFEHLAVAENGEQPLITVYTWPTMDVVTVLEGGTTSRFSHLAYSPDGLLLVSQGGEPDYFITVWNWRQSSIALRCKSYVQEVYCVAFAQSLPGHLTSCGSGHVKFWKMSRTFTGLKLKGESGRFGKTEISDVVAVYPMPDETVISGCEWGNILLWDEGLIKLEVCRKNRQTSHEKYVTQFEYFNGELISVGMDGWIRFWFYETIDHADLPDDDRFLEIQPIYEFHVGDERDAMLMCIRKQEPDDPEQTLWYAQDADGAIWLIDLCTARKPQPPQKIFACHSGPICDISTALWGPYVASLDASGLFHVYDYLEKELRLVHRFRDPGQRLLWLPVQVESSGSTLVCAFSNGVLRMIAVDLRPGNQGEPEGKGRVRLLQVLKPHTMSVTSLTLNSTSTLMVSGSQDRTIFAFHLQSGAAWPRILPLGYVRLPSAVTCLAWSPRHETTVLAGCSEGQCAEIVLPSGRRASRVTTYELETCEPRILRFSSVKSSIRREVVRREQERQREERMAKKQAELRLLLSDNPQIAIDQEAFLMDFHEDPPLPEVYIPERPNAVLVAEYTDDGNVWLLMSGFDAGYVYEYRAPSKQDSEQAEPLRSREIQGAEDTEVHSCLFYKKRKYLVLGTQRGEIRVSKWSSEDATDLSDHWTVPAHDYYSGRIGKMAVSFDGRLLLTCGDDGNLFSFQINDDEPLGDLDVPVASEPKALPERDVEDIEDADHPSLEEVVTRAERNRLLEAAKRKKEETLAVVCQLAEEYVMISNRNQTLLPSQQITDLELDRRITEDLERQLESQMALTRRKLAYKVERSKAELQKLLDHFVTPITCLPFAVRSAENEEKVVHSLREQKLDPQVVKRNIERLSASSEAREPGRSTEETKEEGEEEEAEDRLTQFAEGLVVTEDFEGASTGLGMQIRQLLGKYKEKRARLQQREREWKEMRARKPDLKKSRSEDDALLEEARRTIGEYNLKTSYDVRTSERSTGPADTALSKYKQLVACRNRIHYLREEFNERLRNARTMKQNLREEILRITEDLRRIRMEIPSKYARPLPQVPNMDLEEEFPEYNLELEKYTSMTERMQQSKRGKQSTVLSESYDPDDLDHPQAEEGAQSPGVRDSLSAVASSSAVRVRSRAAVHPDALRALGAGDVAETPWEREMRRSRMARRVYEQDCLHRRIEDGRRALEDELDRLEVRRLEIVAESVYADLFLLTLYEEFVVLKECEVREGELRRRAERKGLERKELRRKIEAATAKTLSKEEEIRKLHSKIKNLAAQFSHATADAKFNKFLHRIFRKKYSSLRKKDDSQDTSTVTSESSSEDSESADSTDMEELVLDEDICPPGCDKELYDMAFALRSKRHELEHLAKEEQRDVEALRKETEADARFLKTLVGQVASSEQELETFMVEKQRKLNDIDVTVVMKFHQLQHVSEPGVVPEMKDCVVFDRKKLSQLYARVGELQKETEELQERRRINRTHLRRIKQDCRYMERRNRQLEEEIKEEQLRKFGRRVSLTSLYESVLQRMMYDVRADTQGMSAEFDRKMEGIRKDCDKELEVLEGLVRDNTEKLTVLTVLEREKAKLDKILRRAPLSEEKMQELEREDKRDLEELERILESQMEQKRLLENDIKNLRMRTKKLPPICLKKTNL